MKKKKQDRMIVNITVYLNLTVKKITKVEIFKLRYISW